jgi:hypothetical protein
MLLAYNFFPLSLIRFPLLQFASLLRYRRCREQYDPNTGETVFFSWRLLAPFAYYSVIAADGLRTIWEEPIPGFTRPTMMHDFAITPTYSM